MREVLSRGISNILIEENYEHFGTFFNDAMAEYKRERRQEAGVIAGATSGGIVVLSSIIAGIAAALSSK